MEGRRETLIKEREQGRVKNIKKRVNMYSNSVINPIVLLTIVWMVTRCGKHCLIAVNQWYLTSVQPTFPTSLSADSESLEEAPSLRKVSSEIARHQTV